MIALRNLSAMDRSRLASALESGVVAEPASIETVRLALGDEPDPRVLDALVDLHSRGLSNRVIAVFLRELDDPTGPTRLPDLVLSGPQVPGVFSRETGAVFEEMIANARRTIWLSTYAFFDGPKAFGPLAKRMDEQVELVVNLLLNVERPKHSTTVATDIVDRFTARFWEKDWPGKRRPNVFYDPRSLDPGSGQGVLHAKAVVVDDELLLVTSANLTESAFEKNIEVGLLVRDRSLALSVAKHFQSLIGHGLLLPLSS